MRRVVVTGLGIVSPLGCGAQTVWERLVNGQTGIQRITKINVDDMTSQVGGQVPTKEEDPEAGFDPDSVLSEKERRKVGGFIVFGVAAADEAVRDSGWVPQTEEDRCRTGVIMGSGIGGLDTISTGVSVLEREGPRRVSPFFMPSSLINLISGQVSIRHGFKGPNHSVVTACATGTHAIGDAARFIASDDADVMVAGGAESPIVRIGVAGFAAVKALSTSYNETPEEASRPWDQGRDGFVIGEGAGALVLEEYEHAKQRGAKIYAEVIGYGLSGDAYHITSPAPDGDGGYRAMKAAIDKAGISIEEIDYINAHGTSTPKGDLIELQAIRKLLGETSLSGVSISSTKSSIGHLLGAAGAVEAIFAVKAITEQEVPPTLNLRNPDPACEGMDLVPLKSKKRPVSVVLSNSFGFGGTNASLVFRKID